MISFTDNQIQEFSGQVLQIPQDIEDLGVSRAKLVQIKQDYKDLDNGNAAYTTHFYNVIAQYHEELKYLNGVTYTNPVIANIDPSAQLSPGNTYFPTSWGQPLQPQLQNSDKGLPTGSFAATEATKYTAVSKWITLLKTGFNDNTGSTTLTAASTAAKITVLSVAGFSIGNRILVLASGSTNYAYGTINNITGSDIFITVELGNLLSVGSSGTATASHTGFTLAERESNTGLTFGELGYANGLKAQIDTSVQDWEDTINFELTALNNNPAGGVESTAISAEIAIISALISAIDTWQALPTTGVTSRYGAAIDTYITSIIATRPGQIATRIATITTYLGTLTQISSGVFSGSGAYYKYFNTLNIRIHKSSGTLRNYYAIDIAINAIDQDIAVKQAALTRETQTFDIKQFSGDGNGSDTIKVKDVAGLSNGQTVKITSNTKGVVTTTIVAINDLSVQLAASIAADYTVADKARLVRQLQ